MSKASLYECCVAVNKAQKKQKLYNTILSTGINQIWPPFMFDVARIPKSRVAAIMNMRYGLSSNLEEYENIEKAEKLYGGEDNA